MQVNRRWYTKDNKEEMQELLMQNKIILDKLKQLCYNGVQEGEQKRRSPARFDDPNWAYEQAFTNGYLHALYQLEDLFTITED